MSLHTAHPAPATLGQLKSTGYRFRTIKAELRENLIARLRDREPVFPGIVGYEQTVLPQVIHGILSLHDMLFLGLRGQAKTRMLRQLPALLDEWMPVLRDVEVPDDPMQPMTAAGRRLVREQGDDAAIRWLHRDERYHEKLATPDVTIADLIGEVDLVKHAEGRYLSDEATMHFGMIPRTNRGIFAINELPDLSPRIQVGLFNVLEERDVQIRGYPIRLNLDVCLVFSANPEDYTNRGRIVTPLKDRIGSVIRTHYPLTLDDSMRITRENAWIERNQPPSPGSGDGNSTESHSPALNEESPASKESGAALKAGHRAASPQAAAPRVEVPAFMHRIIEEMVSQARRSPHINQASGVSVRASIACLENLVSSAERRGLITGEERVVPRVCDLEHLVASCRGKIELMMAEDGQGSEDKLVRSLFGEAIKAVFEEVADLDDFANLSESFQKGLSLTVTDETSAHDVAASLGLVTGLSQAATKLAKAMKLNANDPHHLAAAGEFLLEALYVNNRLSKSIATGGTKYRR